MTDWAIALAIIGSIGIPTAAWLWKRNGKAKKNPASLTNDKSGDMAIQYWMLQFQHLNEKLDEIIELLKVRGAN